LNNLNMNISITWFRMFSQVFLLLVGLGLSVVVVLEKLLMNVQEDERVLAKSELINTYEMKELNRSIELEAHLNRQSNLEITGQIAGTLAHDLRNTLQLILGIEIIKFEDLSIQELDNVIKNVHTGLEDAESLSKQLLTPSQFVPIPIYQERSLLSKHIRQFVRQSKQYLPKNIELTIDIEECGEVLMEPVNIRRILSNLINNACEAMLGEGSISVSLYQRETYAELIINDSGPGIEDAVMEKMFDAYFSTKSMGEGTGLGLHAVSIMMHQIGGHIKAESQLGEGATMILKFPTISSISA
jgi:two-component system, cell cycle sensor histidine kinase and response regulator CckA